MGIVGSEFNNGPLPPAPSAPGGLTSVGISMPTADFTVGPPNPLVANGTIPIIWKNGILHDNSGINSVAFYNRLLYNATGTKTADYQNEQLFDASTVLSVNWNSRLAADGSGSLSIDWLMIDAANSLSIDYGNRILQNGAGTNIFLWANNANMPNLQNFTDDATAGGAGLTTGDLYQTVTIVAVAGAFSIGDGLVKVKQ